MAAAWVGCLSAALWAQDSESPASLGDIARQTRALHTSNTETKPNKAQELVDDMQQEQEAADNAPVGFKNYDAGDYRLYVPYPFTLEGRDNGGAVLLGSRLGVTHTEVLAGAPVPIPPYITEASLGNFVQQLASRYSGYPSCGEIQIGSHKGYRCNMSSGGLMGHPIEGSMEFVVASNTLIPVLCATPNDVTVCAPYDSHGRQGCDSSHPAWNQRQRDREWMMTRNEDLQSAARVCDVVVYPSIQLKEDIVVHPASIAESKPRATASPVAQDTSVAAGPQAISPAEVARQTRLAQHSAAQASATAEGHGVAPAGFQSFVFQYCQHPQQCAEAALVIPEKAQIVSHVNGQHIFKVELDGAFALLYAGPADVNAPFRSLTEQDWIRMRDLANTNGWSHEKAEAVSTQEVNFEGRSGWMTRVRYQRDGQRWWIGERLLITLANGQFLLGCTAPEEHFADAEPLCTAMVNSVRLP